MKTRCIQKTGVIFLLLMFLAIGCSEDFLNTKQMGVKTLDEFYQTDSEAFEALMGCYDKLQEVWVGQRGFNYAQTLQLLSDEVYCGGSRRGDGVALEEINEFRYGSANQQVYNLFSGCYNVIYTANNILDRVTPDTDIKKVIYAEAKAIRAHAYFQLVVMFGDVPLVLNVLTADDYAQPRTPANEVWAQIEKDLTEAIPDLPLRSAQSQRDKARISKGTAQSMLGKAYLFQDKFAEAATVFDQVITSNEYDLYPDYSKILRRDSEFGVESLFEIVVPDNQNYQTHPQAFAGEFTWLCWFYGPKGGGWFEGGPNVNIYTGGFNFMVAKWSFYQQYVDAGEVVRLASSIISETDLKALGGNMRNPAFATPALPEGTLAWSCDPCIRLKYAPWMTEAGANTTAPDVNFGTNQRIIRFADVLLMAAEANNRKTPADDIKAQLYLNRVRARVLLPPVVETGTAMFDAIKKERKFELAFEGHRFHDLIRWGEAATALADQGKQIPKGDGTYLSVPDAGFKARNLLFPIPEQEMAVNPKMTQNQGY